MAPVAAALLLLCCWGLVAIVGGTVAPPVTVSLQAGRTVQSSGTPLYYNSTFDRYITTQYIDLYNDYNGIE